MTHASLNTLAAIIEDWLGEPDLVMICGHWPDGAIMELMPQGKAELLPPKYDGEFAGVRDIDLHGTPHHLHLNLSSIGSVDYVVAPSVCYGFRPSLEVQLTPRAETSERPALRLGLSCLYDRGKLSNAKVNRYFQFLARHQHRHGDLVRFCPSRLPRDAQELLHILGSAADRASQITGLAPSGERSRLHEALLNAQSQSD